MNRELKKLLRRHKEPKRRKNGKKRRKRRDRRKLNPVADYLLVNVEVEEETEDETGFVEIVYREKEITLREKWELDDLRIEEEKKQEREEKKMQRKEQRALREINKPKTRAELLSIYIGFQDYLENSKIYLEKQEKKIIINLLTATVSSVVGKIPLMNKLKPVVRVECQKVLNYMLLNDRFLNTLGWEEEYLMYCLNSFVCSGPIYDSLEEWQSYTGNTQMQEEEEEEEESEEELEEELEEDGVRRTQCMFCRLNKPCLAKNKKQCSKSSQRMRCDALSCVHLCNAHGLRFGVSVDRQPLEDLELEDGRILKTTFHIAKKKKGCTAYNLKGKRTINKKEEEERV